MVAFEAFRTFSVFHEIRLKLKVFGESRDNYRSKMSRFQFKISKKLIKQLLKFGKFWSKKRERKITKRSLRQTESKYLHKTGLRASRNMELF